MDGLIEIEAEEWVRGGTPADSRIVPWGVQSIDSDDIAYWQGRVTSQLVSDVIESLVDYLRA